MRRILTALTAVALAMVFAPSYALATEQPGIDSASDGLQELAETIDSLLANSEEAKRHVAFAQAAVKEVADLKTEMAAASFDSSVVTRVTEELMRLLNKKNGVTRRSVHVTSAANADSTIVVKEGYHPVIVEFYADVVRLRLGIPISSLPVLANGETFATERDYQEHLSEHGFMQLK